LTLSGATVRITSGTFSVGSEARRATTAGTSITAAYKASTETLTLSGSDTLAHYSQVLDSVTFVAGENPTNYSANPTRTVVWTLNDGAASNNLSSPVTETVSITNVNDAPTLAGVAASTAYTEEGGAVSLAAAAAVSDPDNLKLVSATVRITSGTF